MMLERPVWYFDNRNKEEGADGFAYIAFYVCAVCSSEFTGPLDFIGRVFSVTVTRSGL